DRAGKKSRSVSERKTIGKLDLRRPLRASIRAKGRRNCQTPCIYHITKFPNPNPEKYMSNVQVSNEAIVPNAKRLLFAGFMAILAAGVGFGIRGGILANWGAAFGFTGKQLGDINGAGFTGFCFGIIIGGV